MKRISFTGLALAVAVSASATGRANERQGAIDAADRRIAYISEHKSAYATMPLEKFTFANDTWRSRPLTESEMIHLSCTSETSIDNTVIQHCVDNSSQGRPTLITKIVSERSIKPKQKRSVYSDPIMLMLYDFNADGINEGDIIKTRYRNGTAVNYTMGFRESVYETWEAMKCNKFQIVKSGEGGWFFRKLLGWKKSDLNSKYTRLLHSDRFSAEAKDFAEKFADITRGKIADYVDRQVPCK